MEQEMTIDLLDLYEIIKKRLRLIITVTIATTLVSAILSFFILQPKYESSTSIIIGKETGEQTTQSDVMMFQSLMKTYVQIAQSDSTAKIAAKKVGEDVDYKDLQEITKVQDQTGTQVLTISVTDKDPQVAAKEVNEIADAFIQESARLLPTGTVNIMDKGVVPEYPVKPNKKLNLAIGFLLGIVASVGFSFVIEFLDRTIKTEKDIERYLELPIMGIIPKHGAGK